MNNTVTEAIKLYGTDEPVEPMQVLTAGPLTACFDQGALRFIKILGKEVIRNIAFVVRDKDWGTYQPTLSNLQINQLKDSFTVTFDAVCADDNQKIQYTASIRGDSDGTLSFDGDYTAVTDFLTNRTGFVVLHPVSGISGHPVTIEHVDGTIEQSEFPALVDPVQPFKDIRAMTHEVQPGVSVRCCMTGDSFETEDHRQWNDASYKTYVRPLALPWPYTLPEGESQRQSVTLTIEGTVNASATSESREKCIVSVSAADGSTMPGIGLGTEPQHLDSAQAVADLLKPLNLQQLVIWHELGTDNVADLRKARELAEDTGIDLVLHAVIPDDNYQTEVAKLATQCREANIKPKAISVTPAIYLTSIMPGKVWPEVTSLADLYEEVRKHFFGITLGGGMLSFFPELNRHRPPTANLDYITHASNTITHACDDITVTENLEAIPWIIKTCRSFADNKPYHVGPSSIGMRFNPYGSKTMDNPQNGRIAMARMEPRQRGLINAAWTVGYVAHMARGDVDMINLHAPTGEFGIINQQQAWSQPGFDDSDRLVYPVYHTVADFANAAGMPRLNIESSMSREVEAVGYQSGDQQVIWIANLTNEQQDVALQGLNSNTGSIAIMSLDTFDTCTMKADGFLQTTREQALQELELGPYTVTRLTC